MPPPGEGREPVPAGLVLLFVGLVAVILIAGTLFYQSQEAQIADRVTTDLSSIAALKADQIVAWREDRLYDARVISSGAFFIEGADHYLTYGDDESREKILTRFREMNASPYYHNVMLVDPRGNVRLSLDPTITGIQPIIKAQVGESLEDGNAVMADFHHVPGTNHIYLDVIAPLIMKTGGSEKPVGAVLLSIDPDDFLYRFIQSWPVPSESAETLLVEREGDHVLYLNELRHQPNTALNLTIPLSRTDLPAVMAVLGTTGPFTGRDYRGIDVISVLEPIPGSPWFIVAKVDTAEAFSSWRSSAILIIALVVGTLAGALVIVGLFWQRRQKYYYRTLYAAETARREEEQRNRERMEVLLQLSGMESATERELADYVLDAGCRLTDSTLAFIGVMSPDESVFDITAWSKSAMKDCSVATTPIHFPIEKAGIWAEAVRKRQPLIVNDYAGPQMGKKGLPPGHVPITRFTSVPIFEGQRIVMVCAVANKGTDYTDTDVENLTLLMQGVWSHLRKRSADEALRQKTTDLEAAFEEITASEEELQANYEELARSQQALAESERKYRNLYQYAQVGLFETSFKDATVVACNRRYADLAGFPSVEEAIGKDILGLYVNLDDHTEVSRILREQGYIENHTVKFRNQATGKLFWGQFSARFNYEREVAEGTIIDVTAQKEAGTEIQNAKNFLASVIEQSPNPIWISDEKGTLLRLNKACCDVLHITPEEVVGKYNVFEDSIVESQGKMPLVRSVFEEGKSVNFDLEYDSKLLTSLALEQYAKVYLNVTIFPIRDSTGKITNAVIQHLDFTGRRKAEAELAAAQQRYRDLFENVSIGLLRSTPGPQGTFIEANPAALSIFEADSRELLFAVHPSDLYLDPDTRRRIREEILARGLITGMEVRFKTLKGRIFWGRMSTIKKTSDDGQTYFDNTIEDITDRKRAEEKIKTTETRYRRLFESARDGILILNRDTGEIIDANPFIESLLGYSVHDIIGKHLWDIGILKDRLLSKIAFEELQAKKYIKYEDLPLETKDGQRIEVEFVSYVYPIDHTLVIQCNIRDITDRKRAEDALRETAEYLNKLIDFASAPIIVWDPAFTITRFNHAFERLAGRTEQEVIGQPLEILFPEENRDDSFTLIRETLKGRRWESVKIPILASDGTVRTVLWNSATILTAEAELVSTIAQGMDITEIERTEVQREALIRELEQKNAELELFTFTVSHDLKSPLITIKGFAGLLEDDTRKCDPLQLKKDVHRITEAAETMQALLADLLELSRVGKIIKPPENIPFGRIAHEAVDLLAGPLAERGVNVEIAPNLPIVDVDHARIREVMINLIENAVKFFGDCENPVIQIGVDRSGETPVFFVQDNGIGIDPRYLERIFKLFEKLDASAHGTGIGLTIVRRIIEVHGGKIWAESEGIGKGTTFKFTLPGPADRGEEK